MNLHNVGIAAGGVAIAAAVMLALGGHALWTQFHGPLAESGSPWRIDIFGNSPADFVTAPTGVALHGSGFARFLATNRQFPQEYDAYLGWPLLVGLAAAAAWSWRDLRTRAAAVCWVVLEVLSLGDHAVRLGPWLLPADAMPWHWLGRLPLLSQLVPNRFSVIADGAAAAVLAFAIDRAWRTIPAGRPALRLAFAGALGIALVPVIPAGLATATVWPVPAGWSAALTRLHLPARAPVLMLPVDRPRAMLWQAVTGDPYSIAGGFCIAPLPGGHAATCGSPMSLTADQIATIRLLNRLADGRPGTGPRPAAMLAAVRVWRPAAVLSPAGSDPGLRRYLTGFFGQPTVHEGGVLGWRLSTGWQPRQPS